MCGWGIGAKPASETSGFLTPTDEANGSRCHHPKAKSIALQVLGKPQMGEAL